MEELDLIQNKLEGKKIDEPIKRIFLGLNDIENPPFILDFTERDYFFYLLNSKAQSKEQRKGIIWANPRDVAKNSSSGIFGKSDDRFGIITKQPKEIKTDGYMVRTYPSGEGGLSPERTVIIISDPRYNGQIISKSMITQYEQRIETLNIAYSNLQKQMNSLIMHIQTNHIEQDIANDMARDVISMVSSYNSAKNPMPLLTHNQEEKQKG